MIEMIPFRRRGGQTSGTHDEKVTSQSQFDQSFNVDFFFFGEFVRVFHLLFDVGASSASCARV